MLTLTTENKIFVYITPIDLRKAINGLVMLLVDVYKQNPQTGDVFIFTNRERNKIKALFWDNNGFVLYYKRIERGRFNYSKYLQGDEIIISETQLRALMIGLDFHLVGNHTIENSEHFF